MLTRGTLPRRALWRLARPLPRPGPRCSSVAPGEPDIRPYPSAAPVATPSNSASTARISGTESRAATKCISEVPGLVKQVVTPASTSVRIRASAPFMAWPVILKRDGGSGRRRDPARTPVRLADRDDQHSVQALDSPYDAGRRRPNRL